MRDVIGGLLLLAYGLCFWTLGVRHGEWREHTTHHEPRIITPMSVPPSPVDPDVDDMDR